MPSRQGRLAFVYLCLRRGQPVPKDSLAEALWVERPPARWEVAINAIVSKLRVSLGRVGLDPARVLPSAFGGYALQLPEPAWVDVEAAHDAVHGAEAALRSGEVETAYGPALVAGAITRRPFLPGEATPWVEEFRRRLSADRLRALDCLVRCLRGNGEVELAEQRAEEAIELDPYRESGYLSLMQLHAASGNPRCGRARVRALSRPLARGPGDLAVAGAAACAPPPAAGKLDALRTPALTSSFRPGGSGRARSAAASRRRDPAARARATPAPSGEAASTAT
jgi:SARP family transcriptional regulator, regulator of embCAB operon